MAWDLLSDISQDIDIIIEKKDEPKAENMSVLLAELG